MRHFQIKSKKAADLLLVQCVSGEERRAEAHTEGRCLRDLCGKTLLCAPCTCGRLQEEEHRGRLLCSTASSSITTSSSSSASTLPVIYYFDFRALFPADTARVSDARLGLEQWERSAQLQHHISSGGRGAPWMGSVGLLQLLTTGNDGITRLLVPRRG